jgi:hypothetical protein
MKFLNFLLGFIFFIFGLREYFQSIDNDYVKFIILILLPILILFNLITMVLSFEGQEDSKAIIICDLITIILAFGLINLGVQFYLVEILFGIALGFIGFVDFIKN